MNNNSKIIILVVATAVAIAAGCGFIRPDNLKMISPVELQQLIAQQDIFLVDVHIPEQKHISGTDYHVSFLRISDNAQIFPSQKDAPIYLYCETGPMANWAARSLYKLGYTNIYSLEGGMDAWLEAGLPAGTAKVQFLAK